MSDDNPFVRLHSFTHENIRVVKEKFLAQQLRHREEQFSSFAQWTVFCGTWNINGQIVKESLEAWLNHKDADILVLGFQELDLNTQAYIIADSLKEDAICNIIESSLLERYHLYRRLSSKKLVGIYEVIYIKNEHFSMVSEISTEYVTLGILGVMGNKGAVAIRFKAYDSYFVFVNCHLAADPTMVDRRNQDFQEICKRMVFPIQSKYKDYQSYAISNPWVPGIMDCKPYNFAAQYQIGNLPTSEQFVYGFNRFTTSIFDCDHLFWMGDLNYRVTVSEKEAKEILKASLVSDLLKYDQLIIEKQQNRAFFGFQEAVITFQPTFKYDVGTNQFDSSEKKRAPSFTDRILNLQNPLKSDDSNWAVNISYDSCMDISASDHKPLSSVYSAKVYLKLTSRFGQLISKNYMKLFRI